MASPNSQGTKRQRMNQNFIDNSSTKKTPNTQLRLKTFDSFDPQSQNKEITIIKDEVFTLVGKKKDNGKKLVLQSTSTNKSTLNPLVETSQIY